MTALAVEGLAAGWGGREVVSDVTLTLRAGEVLVLVGPNGAGKSTLLAALAGHLPPLRGTIRLDGRDVGGLPPAALARAGLALVPQRRNVFRGLTVAENLAAAAWPARDAAIKRRVRVLDLFPALRDALGRPAGLLSGGQRQTLALGMALMAGPSLLLLDEPTAGLAPAALGEVLDLLLTLRAEGIGILLVEQNAAAALARADRAGVLVAGRLVRLAAAEEVAREDLAALFLGAA